MNPFLGLWRDYSSNHTLSIFLRRLETWLCICGAAFPRCESAFRGSTEGGNEEGGDGTGSSDSTRVRTESL
jgi:hypothetical protein